jgi:large conductance mechanosensitive channel
LGKDNDPGTIPPPPPPLAPVSRSFAQQFFDFLNTFAIIGLAIAFVIGAAASKLVTAFVEDIINPTVGLFLRAGELTKMSANVTGVSGATSQFMYGDLTADIIDFLIIALVVFVAFKFLSKLVEDKTKPESK